MFGIYLGLFRHLELVERSYGSWEIPRQARDDESGWEIPLRQLADRDDESGLDILLEIRFTLLNKFHKVKI